MLHTPPCPAPQSIATQYGDDPAHFATEVYELDGLRASATRPGDYMQSLALLKRYSCQLQALVRRFPQLAEQHVDDLVFHWWVPGVTLCGDGRMCCGCVRLLMILNFTVE